MNLWFRLIWTLLTARRKPQLFAPTDAVTQSFRVLPFDLDISRHMNNGRYLTIMDLGRLEFMFRSRLWEIVRRDRLTPMVAAIAIRYRRELRPFQAYTLATQIVGWRDTTVVFEQKFIIRGGRRDGQVAARALVRAGIYNRKERHWETVQDLMTGVGADVVASPKLPSDVEAFLAAEDAMQGTDRMRRTLQPDTA